jgi:anti-sigma factor (TIGR02949 family)
VTCREFIDFLMAYLDGELPPDQRQEFERHINKCGPCVAYLDTYQATIRLGKSACKELDKEVPDCVPDELVDAILAARKKDGAGGMRA